MDLIKVPARNRRNRLRLDLTSQTKTLEPFISLDTEIWKGGIREFSQCYNNLVLDRTEKNTDISSEKIGNDLSEQTSKLNIETTMELLNVPLTNVLPFLYLGNSKDAQNEKSLDENNIRLVLNLTCNCDNHFMWRNDIKYKQVKIEDSCKEDIMPILLDSVRFIDSARVEGCAVLVHCQGGVSRSAAITIAFLMYHLNLSLKDAYKFVKEKRSCIAPNLNFMGQLMEFEKQLSQSKVG